MWRSRICGWKTKMQCKNFLTVDIAVTTSDEMFCFQVILLSHSIQCSWSEIKMSFSFWSCVFASGTLLDRRCLAFICDIASLQESDIFPFNSVVTVWLDHCWCLVQDCALTVVWVCDDGSFSFFVFLQSCFCALICGVLFLFPYR